MKIEEAITKAFEGGYKGDEEFVQNLPEYAKCQIWLDPLFWQALGKVMGWGKNIDGSKESPFGQWHQWKTEWHYFIDALAEGKTVEQFFETLN